MVRTWNESDMLLAVKIVQNNPQMHVTQIARIYKVPYTTLCCRVRGRSAKQDTIPKSRKLTQLEEETIVRHILDLDSRSFPPRVSCVEDMANRLLADRNAQRVGKNWTTNFVRQCQAPGCHVLRGNEGGSVKALRLGMYGHEGSRQGFGGYK